MTRARAALLALAGCFVALATAALVVSRSAPVFDRAHPDHAALAARFADAERAFAAGEDWAVVDLAALNGGGWRTACLFGGFTRPVEHLEALGAVVSAADRRRLAEPLGLRLSPLEEYEMLIGFSDEQGRAHFIHFDQGVGAEGQHYQGCVTRPETKVAIATWRTLRPGTPPPLLE